MMNNETIIRSIEERARELIGISDRIWGFAEQGYEEQNSSAVLCNVLEREGFRIERGISGIATAFAASFGTGTPVIGILGEYDAQAGMSQEAGVFEKRPCESSENGHACGHHAIGAGALGAALALRDYLLERSCSGTVRYIGCPAAESGSGKVFLARDGWFDSLDAVFTWHPFSSCSIMSYNYLASLSGYFRFHGRSSHAAGAPHLGRSALDAVTLMNLGVNYLREHVESDVRVHYAVTDAGGKSPNVVQPQAEVLYQLRAPEQTQVTEVFGRVMNIAQGAALMTETEMEFIFDKASSNVLHNSVLASLVYEQLMELGPVPVDAEDISAAERLRNTFSEREKKLDEFIAVAMFGRSGKNLIASFSDKAVIDIIFPYEPEGITVMGSSDIGDASWQAPTVSFQLATYAKDTAPHSWQMAAQGKSDLFHKAVLHAGKIIALAGVRLLEDGELVVRARKEFALQRAGRTYTCPIPEGINPTD